MTAPNTNQRDSNWRETPSGLTLPLPSPLMAMLPPNLQGYPMQWFVEPIDILAVTPLGTKSNQFTTDGTHVHVSFYGSLKVRSSDNQTDRDADPATYSMADTLTLQYQTSGQLLDTSLVWGSAKQPAVWPVPLIVPQNSGIILTIVNQSTVNTNSYHFGFMGVLIKVPSSLTF